MSDQQMRVPYFRPTVSDDEVDSVVSCLRSGWLTSGPRVKQFEEEFAHAVGARHAIALNSCTAALHLAAEAVGVRPGDAVLVPTMTFAATAEVVRYQGAVPVLVDCDPATGNMDLHDAADKVTRLRRGERIAGLPGDLRVVGMLPVHVGGFMMSPDALSEFASAYGLWMIEDAAHAFPAAWRPRSGAPWRRCGEETGLVTCFSFYANKTITTGEGGMAVTNDSILADRIRMMSLHGLSHDAWGRFSGRGSWDYRILAPGYKYNLTDIAASLGLGQLKRAEQMRRDREEIAARYLDALREVDEIGLPRHDSDRIHSWHLFPIRLRLDRLDVDRDTIFQELRDAGALCSVHWRPLHLHPYYEETFGWAPEHCPAATALWPRLVSLPIFSGMRAEETSHVIEAIKAVCARHTCRAVAAGGVPNL